MSRLTFNNNIQPTMAHRQQVVNNANGEAMQFPNLYKQQRPAPTYYRSNVYEQEDGTWAVRHETEHEVHSVPVSVFGSNYQGEKYVMTPQRLATNHTYNINQEMEGNFTDRSDRDWERETKRRQVDQVQKLKKKRLWNESPAGNLNYRNVSGKQALNRLMGKRLGDPNNATQFARFVPGTEADYVHRSVESFTDAAEREGLAVPYCDGGSKTACKTASVNLPIGPRRRHNVSNYIPGHPEVIDRISSIRARVARNV